MEQKKLKNPWPKGSMELIKLKECNINGIFLRTDCLFQVTLDNLQFSDQEPLTRDTSEDHPGNPYES